MLGFLKGLFFQPKKQKTEQKKVYHFILLYENENGHFCTFRTYATTYQGAKAELFRQNVGRQLSNISLKSKNLQ
jgi:hypothetical protein